MRTRDFLYLAGLLAVPVAILGCAADAEDERLGHTSYALGTAIDRCGSLSASGRYFLSKDVAAADADCIVVDAPGRSLALDCGGHTISGDARPGHRSPSGVFVKSGSVTLSNCVVDARWFDDMVDVGNGGTAILQSGTYRDDTPGDTAFKRIATQAGGHLYVFGGAFRAWINADARGPIDIYGGDFSGSTIKYVRLWGGNIHDSVSGAVNSSIFGGNFYRNSTAVYFGGSSGNLVAGGTFYSNGIAVRIDGGGYPYTGTVEMITGGRFFGNGTDVVVNGASLVLDGGEMCDAGKTNIDVKSGLIRGDEDATRARCRAVSPSGIYSCNPCPAAADAAP